MRRDQRNLHHLATISHDGRFWDAYLEIEEPATPEDPARGRIAFSAADEGEVEPVRTTTIFIENTAQDVVTRAREFKTHQLVALLRSAMPPEMERAGADGRDHPGGAARDAAGDPDAAPARPAGEAAPPSGGPSGGHASPEAPPSPGPSAPDAPRGPSA